MPLLCRYIRREKDEQKTKKITRKEKDCVERQQRDQSQPLPRKASVEPLIGDAETDRITSKRTIKQLQFGHGAPKTQESQSLRATRFNAFRQHTLKQSLKTPFTGYDLVRFFDAIIRKLGRCDCQVSSVVLCAIGGKPSRCDLAKPSVPMQRLETIKLRGIVSNILTRV